MRPQAMIEQTLNLVTTKDHQQVAVWQITADSHSLGRYRF